MADMLRNLFEAHYDCSAIIVVHRCNAHGLVGDIQQRAWPGSRSVRIRFRITGVVMMNSEFRRTQGDSVTLMKGRF